MFMNIPIIGNDDHDADNDDNDHNRNFLDSLVATDTYIY